MVSERSLKQAIKEWVYEQNTGNFTTEEAIRVVDALAHEYLGYYLEMSAQEIKEETDENTVVDALKYLFDNELEISFTKGRYSDWGKAGSFVWDGDEYNFILNEDEAERIAIDLIKQDLEYEPELFEKNWLMNHVNEERYANDISSDIEEWIREEPDSYSNFFSDSDLIEGIIEYLKKEDVDDILKTINEYEEIRYEMDDGKPLEQMVVIAEKLLHLPPDETIEGYNWEEVIELVEDGEVSFNGHIDKQWLLDEVEYALGRLDTEELIDLSESILGEIPYDAIYHATEKYIDDVIMYDLLDWLEGLGYSGNDLYEHLMPYLDIDELAEDAVATDGWAHFLSLYDGSYEVIKNGVVVFRE